ILLIIIGLITVNRSQYTKNLRDQREWNRRRFPRYKELPTPPCPNSLDGLTASYNELKKYTNNAQANASNYAQTVGPALSRAG
ncbi:MAG: hypothetical protein EBT86_12620, partial [Actinobacteria bacterium]|nr:hypothetical protein [Actinomycetota bacterium]